MKAAESSIAKFIRREQLPIAAPLHLLPSDLAADLVRRRLNVPDGLLFTSRSEDLTG